MAHQLIYTVLHVLAHVIAASRHRWRTGRPIADSRRPCRCGLWSCPGWVSHYSPAALRVRRT